MGQGMDKTNDVFDQLSKLEIPLDGLWLPSAANTAAHSVDDAYWLVYWACVISFFAIIIPLFWFMWRYRRKTEGQKAESQEDHSQLIEILWSGLPLVFFIVLFVVGFRGYLDLNVEPANTLDIYVRGSQWKWDFTYNRDSHGNDVKNGAHVGGIGAEFPVPSGVPIKLIMTSDDVLHSFFLPNMRVKADVIPGRYNTLWFEVPEGQEGKFPIFCTEYCGKDHSRMLATLKVVTRNEFDAWLKKSAEAAGGPASVAAGQKIYNSVCVACHTLTGLRTVGPSFKGLWGKEEEMDDGRKIVVNEDYIKTSILEPNKDVVKSYTKGLMPAQKLSETEIQSFILFLKTVK